MLVAGRYRLVDEIGHGGMGTVWHACDEVLDRTVALKEVVLPPDATDADRDTRARRAMREVKAASKVSHRNIVTVFDVLVENGSPWIVMELVPGRSLAEELADGRVSVPDAARIAGEVVSALDAVHRAGIVHRDVKPGNILLARDGRAVLTDFGIAALTGAQTITSTGTTIGTLEYMAPERLRGLRPVPACDLWALGATLYEMLEGRSPFRRNGEFATMQAVLDGGFDPPRHAGELGPVVKGLLTVDPGKRMTAEELLKQLERIQTAAPPAPAEAATRTGVRPPVPPTVPGLSRKPRRPKIAELFMLLGVFLGVSALVLLLDGNPLTSPAAKSSTSPAASGSAFFKPAPNRGLPVNWVSVPEGYSSPYLTERKATAQYCAVKGKPPGCFVEHVNTISNPYPALALMDTARTDGFETFPGYQRVSLTRTGLGTTDLAVLEFTWGPETDSRHYIYLRSSTQEFQIRCSAKDAAAARQIMESVKASYFKT